MLRFSRPKGPGFGISRNFYLSVLSGHAALPTLVDVINPAGDREAVIGFGVPLSPDATKAALRAPIERGAHALATKDRKTVLQMLVLSKEEAGFDPEAIAQHASNLDLSDEMINRIRATWSILQFRFESHDPDVYPALDFLLAVASRLGTMTDGAVADPLAQRYLHPETLFARPRVNPAVDAREHVAVNIRGAPSGVHAYTMGLQKFVQPELEIQGLNPGSEGLAHGFLMGAAQRVLEGKLIQPGRRVGKFEAQNGGLDRGLWEGIPCIELLPPTGTAASDALDG